MRFLTSSISRRRFFSVATLTAIVFGGNILPAQSASVLDLLPGGRETPGYYGVVFEERQPTMGELVSTITSSIAETDKVNSVGGTFLCSSMDDSECTKGSRISARLMLPPCTSPEQRMCIEGLSLAAGSGAMEAASIDHEIASLRTPADPVTGLPAGGGPSLWNAPTVAHKSGGKTYGVSVHVTYFQDRKKIGAESKRANPISLESMRVSVFPVQIVSGRFYPLESYKSTNLDGAPSFGIRPAGTDFDNTEGCAWSELGSCGKYGDFAENTRVALTLRMGSEMTGWLYGRMKNVDVEVTPLDKKFNKIRIEGDPIVAPGAFGAIKKSEIKNYPAIDERIRAGSDDFGYNQLLNSPQSAVGSLDPVGNFKDFAAFEPILKTMAGARAQWVIASGASTNGYKSQVTEKCFQDTTKLLGIVTTNALIYGNGAPEFKDGTLNYKVAGMHHQADGVTLTRGTYDLAIRTETARCVYGFTDAPFEASISVIGADGQEQTIATESIREDKKREWLFLSAQNFTFSSPVIKVKLTQKKLPLVKKTISCIKGKQTKTIKKVTGVNPKCPTGYKKL